MNRHCYLRLYHGRKTPEIDLEEWGIDGPVFRIAWMHQTYLFNIRIGFEFSNREEQLTIVEDMIYYDGVYYGDWEVFTATGQYLDDEIETFDRAKARLNSNEGDI